jgi:hypothetical protein
MKRLWLMVISSLILSAAVTDRCFTLAADSWGAAGAPVDFGRDVYPVLRQACVECHGAKRQEADLRFDRRTELMDSGVIEPGDSELSELVRRITLPRGDEEIMPPVGQPLSQEQQTIIQQWIDQGADWPEDFAVGQHWSYIAPRRPAPPPVKKTDWAKAQLDLFVLHRLELEGLSPSPPASAEKLVRRLYLDLIGIPPSPEEVRAFVVDSSEARYEQLVDDLLARPQFGERWARPWLDLARYADSHGFQRDNLRDIWAYRDWVIRALCADMPFDQFTIEQIAGDLLANPTESQRIATGFHRCAPTNVEAGSLPEETRIEQVIDRVNTTGAVWLGTTLECCQCHDHKYDPLTMKDYYRLLAYYNSTQLEADRTDPTKPSSIQFRGPSMPLANPQRDARRAELERRLAHKKNELSQRRKELAGHLESWVSRLAEVLDDAPRVHPLEVVGFQSQGTTDTHEILADGSVLLQGGDPPDTDTYTVRARIGLSGIRAFRLDVLRDDSLPGKGPGRGDPVRRNFVLTHFSVAKHHPTSSPAQQLPAALGQTIPLMAARASFSQKGWDVSGAIDDAPNTGWAIAPQFNKSHWATFLLKEPLDVSDDTPLVFTLDQRWGRARTIGRLRLSAVTGEVDAESVPAEIVKVLQLPPAKRSKEQHRRLLDYRVERDEVSRRLSGELAELEKQIEQLQPDTTLVMIELPEPRETTVLTRGDYRRPGEVVRAGTPPALHSPPGGPANRLQLARWLVARDNPLVARVTVNRWWAELFGQGIVTTVEDFGAKGEPPTHPQLLDWLAVEFMDNGWSMKRLLKTIVMSATYRQSSRITPELLERDDRNRLLARGPRFRMSAEMVRDNALTIAGLLDLEQFGPPIYPFQPAGIWKKVGGTAYNYKVSSGSQQYRRGIYVVLKRGSPYPSFVNFDATARLACTVKRSRTNTPLQALTLLNDPVYLKAAEALAQRVLKEKADGSLDAQLDFAFQLCTARRPSSAERQTLRELFHQQSRSLQRRTAELNEDVRFMAWQRVATVLLNLHETITKD